MNSTVAVSRESVPSRPSIVAHPWFPKVIGLWFAALFGLCSLAVASDVLERVVTMLGIDRIVPAAAPPLGQTARLLLAMAMAGVGEIVGLVIGGRLAASRRPPSQCQREIETAGRGVAAPDIVPQVRGRDRHADAPPRKPLSAKDDLGGIDQALRRRAPTGAADPEPRPFLAVAPMPGADSSPADPIASAGEPVADPGACEGLDLAPDDMPVEQAKPVEPPPFAAPVVAASAEITLPFTAPGSMVPEGAQAIVASASLDALGVVQLSERLALALQARRERRATLTDTPPADEPEQIAPELQRGPEILARRAPRAGPEADSVAGVDLGEATAPAAPDEVAASAAQGSEGDDPDEVADATGEAGYSSLLAMGASFARPEPVRIEEPQSDEIEPVVIFPGQVVPAATAGTPPPADAEETDRALRAALASLQRISGAR